MAEGGEVRRWCWSRRDTLVRARGRLRGKRGYDEVGARVWRERGSGCGGVGGARGRFPFGDGNDEEKGAGMAVVGAWV